MEKVQYQLEATLPELKDLEDKGLFSKPELRQITLKRTKFESSLIKRMARKQDYFDYADYEIGLERLRRVRWKRLRYDRNPPPTSVSNHSIPRRILHILRRATDRFPHDLSVWMAYVDYARGEGMTKVVGTGLTSALQLHPLASVLYILLSQHYLDPNAPIHASASSPSATVTHAFSIENVSPARKTLLIGLRLLPNDQTLWREYIKLEIGWVEALRRRWKVLGIAADPETEAGEGMDKDVQSGLPAREVQDLGRGAFGDSGEASRKALMRGDLVALVMEDSFKKATLGSSLEYNLSLLSMLRSYPTGLRTRLLGAVYKNMTANPALAVNPQARRAVLEAGLYDRPYVAGEEDIAAPEEWELEEGEDAVVREGSDLLVELGRAVKAMKGWKPESETVKAAWERELGLWLCKWVERMGQNTDAAAYLLSQLTPMLSRKNSPSADVISAYSTYLATLPLDTPALADRSAVQARLNQFTDMHPTSADVWTSRLDLERHFESATLQSTYLSAMNALGATNGALPIWEDAMDLFDELVGGHKSEMQPHWKHALTAAQKYTYENKYPRVDSEALYSGLLSAWVDASLESLEGVPGTSQAHAQGVDAVLREVLPPSNWAPPSEFYATCFESVAAAPLPTEELETRLRRVYKAWTHKSPAPAERVAPVLGWARWLVLVGRGKASEAWKEVQTLEKELEGLGVTGSLMQLKSGWTDILAAAEAPEKEDDSMDEDEEEE